MDKITKPISGAKARRKILKGVNAVYNIIKLTIGPEGKTAILPRSYNRGPRNTNDGVTISENINLKDEHEKLVADSFKEGSKKTNEIVGDGTTATAVVSGYLINEILSSMPDHDVPLVSLGKTESKKGVRALRKDMKDAKDLVIAEIKKQAKPIKTLADLEKIAIVSIGKEDESAAKVVAKMTWDIARDNNGDFVDNHIDVVEGYKGEIETEDIKGMRFPSKIAHRAFMNKPERFEMVAEDTAVFITNYKLDNPYEIMGILDRCKAPKIAFFSPEFSDTTLKYLVDTIKNGIFCYPVKCPSLRTPQLEDLALYTGATLIDKETGRKLESVTGVDLGFAEKIVVKDTENKDDAILIGGKGERIRRGQGTLISERQAMLKKQLSEAKNELSKVSTERRIANLASAVGIIRVGASTSNEGLYLKLKIEDGVYACKAALQEGYVEGGGLCLKKIAEKLPESILTKSLKEPYEQIQKNAGGSLKIGKDIIDPAKVIRLIVEYGVSIAAQMITTDILIPEVREKSAVEGYEAIANAINRYVFMEAKHKGLLKENQEFTDEAQDKAFEEAEFLANKD